METKKTLFTLCLTGLLVGSNCLADQPKNKGVEELISCFKNLKFKKIPKEELRRQRKKRQEELRKITGKLIKLINPSWWDKLTSNSNRSKAIAEAHKTKKQLENELCWYCADGKINNVKCWNKKDDLFMKYILDEMPWDEKNEFKSKLKTIWRPENRFFLEPDNHEKMNIIYSACCGYSLYGFKNTKKACTAFIRLCLLETIKKITQGKNFRY